MSTCKYGNIVEELKKRISGNVYKRRLPGVRLLSAEFQVSSRTVGKALEVLKAGSWVTTDKGGSHIVRRKRPEYSRNIALITSGLLSEHSNEMCRHLQILLEADGNTFVNLTPPAVNSGEFRDFGVNPPLAGVVFVGTYTSVLAQKLKRLGIPFVSSNRLPECEDVSWADWDHAAEFTGIVEYLVAEGYRRIAFFQYLYKNLMEHWLLIQHDFDRVAREFQLRNPDLEVFVREHGWDCARFVDFWLHETRLPEVIVRIGSEAADLIQELKDHGIMPGKDIKILLSKFAPSANKVWAEAIWKLLERCRCNPLAPAKKKMLVPQRIFTWLE